MRRARLPSCLLLLLASGCLRLGLYPFDEGAPDGGGDAADADADEDWVDEPKPDGEAERDGEADLDAEPPDGDLDGEPPDGDLDGPDADGAALGFFGTPAAVSELNLPGANTEDPTLTDDLLEIVFASWRTGGTGGVDLWTSTRPDLSSAWTDPVLVAGVNTGDDESTPEISGDGTLLVFASDRPGGDGLYDLYESTRPSRGAAWSAPQRIAELCSSENEFPGPISPDRLSFIFTSSRAGGLGGGDIYEATRAAAGSAWGSPTLVDALSSADDDSAPWRSSDSRWVYFSSRRPGGLGDQDVWRSRRATTSDPWDVPSPVEELNGPDHDSDPWLSPDLRTIFYSRIEGSVRAIFVATR